MSGFGERSTCVPVRESVAPRLSQKALGRGTQAQHAGHGGMLGGGGAAKMGANGVHSSVPLKIDSFGYPGLESIFCLFKIGLYG